MHARTSGHLVARAYVKFYFILGSCAVLWAHSPDRPGLKTIAIAIPILSDLPDFGGLARVTWTPDTGRYGLKVLAC